MLPHDPCKKPNQSVYLKQLFQAGLTVWYGLNEEMGTFPETKENIYIKNKKG